MYFNTDRHAPVRRAAWWVVVALVLFAHGALLNVGWEPPTPEPAPPNALGAVVATGAVATRVDMPTAAAAALAETDQPTPVEAPRRAAQPHTPPFHRTSTFGPTELGQPLPAPAPVQAPVPISAAAADTDATQDTQTTPPGPLKWPAATEMRYDVHATRKGLSLSASGTLRWLPTAHSYQARLEIKALLFGQRSQTSLGQLDPAQGLQPTRFGDKIRTEQATHFDRTLSPPRLRFSSNAPDEPLLPHTQDRLSVLFQLAAMWAANPQRFGPGDTVSIHTAGPRDAGVWTFRVGTPAPLAVPLGTLDTVHLVRTPTHPHDNRVELWLAPALGYLPARILWTQANGDVVDQQLAQHNPLGAAP